ncbi:MAG TPA: hypothetical protein VHX13_02335 [Acidobacteriaceae bacterium]|jgi:hypothetical protein|nr:hypothetical protein [Acidobacteriaceae bacterium]
MRPDAPTSVAFALMASMLCGAFAVQAQTASAPYPDRAPLARYLTDPAAEATLARTAAPQSISADAEVLVLRPSGFEVAAQGTNGWACLVERSWNAAVDFPEFWNPKIRSPICFNPAAVRSVLPVVTFWAKRVMAGESKTQMAAQATTAFNSGQLPPLEPGAMSLMLSKEGYLTDDHPQFHPHIMFFEPLGEGQQWGANLPGSPLFAGDDKVNRMAIIPVPVPRWSDGTLDGTLNAHPAK